MLNYNINNDNNNNKIGPLVDKLRELGARPCRPRQQDEEPRGAQRGHQQDHEPNATKSIANGSSAVEDISTEDTTDTTTTSRTTIVSDGTTSAVATETAARFAAASRLASMGYGDERGPLWVRRELAEMMEARMFRRKVDPDNLCIAAGAKCVLR